MNNTLSPKFKFNRNISWFSNLIKRSFDITVSLIVLLLLAPFYGVIAIAIRRDSPGPAIYRGPRMGRGGKPFSFFIRFLVIQKRDDAQWAAAAAFNFHR